MEDRSDRTDQERLGSARQAVRAIGTAFRAIRFYSPGHALTRQAFDHAVAALSTYLSRFGTLGLSVALHGVTFDFYVQPYDDEMIVEFVRALRSGMVGGLRVLPGIHADELGEFLQVLHLPQPRIRGGGGVAVLVRDRGVHNLVVDEYVAEPQAVGAISGPSPDAVLEALAVGPEAVRGSLEAALRADTRTMTRLLRECDRALAVRASDEQETARQMLAQALADLAPRAETSLREIMNDSAEPWAASLLAHWPSQQDAELASHLATDPAMVARMLETLKTLRRPAVTSPPLTAPGVTASEELQAKDELEAAARHVPTHALRRLLEIMPSLDVNRFAECLLRIEGEITRLAEDDLGPIVMVLRGLSDLARRLADGRGEMARATLRRVMDGQVRDLLTRALVQPLGPDHPLYQALHEAADQTVGLLLEMMAEENRLLVRREIVTLLSAFAADRIHLLADHLVDPRWYIVRNVVTVLGGTGRPDVVPYLRAALAHEDSRVRKEALQALGGLRVPQAVTVLGEALHHPDPDTRVAAAHWLGFSGLPQAAVLLAAALQAEPLHENVEVKRQIIRALGRLGTDAGRVALIKVQETTGLRHRRELDELKDEATKALAAIGQAGP